MYIKNLKRKVFFNSLFFIIILSVMMFLIGILMTKKGLWKKTKEINVIFKDVGGLIKGSPIRLAGVSIGIVGEIEFLLRPINKNRVKVQLLIDERYYNYIKNQGLRFFIKNQGVLGDKIIEIIFKERGKKK